MGPSHAKPPRRALPGYLSATLLSISSNISLHFSSLNFLWPQNGHPHFSAGSFLIQTLGPNIPLHIFIWISVYWIPSCAGGTSSSNNKRKLEAQLATIRPLGDRERPVDETSAGILVNARADHYTQAPRPLRKPHF